MSNTIEMADLVTVPDAVEPLVSFSDEAQAPTLSYSIPLPGSYEGRFYLEYEPDDNLPWRDAAYAGKRISTAATGGGGSGSLAERIARANELIHRIAIPPAPVDPFGPVINPGRYRASVGALEDVPLHGGETSFLTRNLSFSVASLETESFLSLETDRVSLEEVEREAVNGNALVYYRSFGGNVGHTFVEEGQDRQTANPRFVVIEHYRLSSLFGSYGAGRTVSAFALWPGEETTLYVRSWRRTEKRMKEASTIFDSYTEEAADSFEESLESENSYRKETNKAKEWKASGGFGLNLGVAKIGGGGGVSSPRSPRKSVGAA